MTLLHHHHPHSRICTHNQRVLWSFRRSPSSVPAPAHAAGSDLPEATATQTETETVQVAVQVGTTCLRARL